MSKYEAEPLDEQLSREWGNRGQLGDHNKKEKKQKIRDINREGYRDLSFLGELVSSSELAEQPQPEFVQIDVVSESTKPITVTASPFPPQTPVPSAPSIQPWFQTPEPQGLAPIVTGQPFKARREDRVPPRADQTATLQVPPIPLSEEYQDLYARMFLIERYSAMCHAERERKVEIWNRWATLVISILGIVGGCIAIRSGLNSVTGRDGRN